MFVLDPPLVHLDWLELSFSTIDSISTIHTMTPRQIPMIHRKYATRILSLATSLVMLLDALTETIKLKRLFVCNTQMIAKFKIIIVSLLIDYFGNTGSY